MGGGGINHIYKGERPISCIDAAAPYCFPRDRNSQPLDLYLRAIHSTAG